MRRPLTTAILMLLFACGAFLLVQQDRFGWAQTGSSAAGTTPTAKPVAPVKASSGAASSGYGSDYAGGDEMGSGGMMGSGYATDGEMGSGMMGSGYGEEGGMGYGNRMGPAPFRVQLNQKAAKLRHATTDHERSQVKSDLEKLLSVYFDKDMEIRQARLDDVKERVAKLEALLNKRQTAKQEIIDLQLKTMVNESEGLGFFSAPTPGHSSVHDVFYGEEGGGYGMQGGGYGGGEMMGGYGEGSYGSEMEMYGGEEESTGRARNSR